MYKIVFVKIYIKNIFLYIYLSYLMYWRIKLIRLNNQYNQAINSITNIIKFLQR